MTVTKWVTLARQCLLRRISVPEFDAALRELDKVDGKELFGAFIECRATFCVPGDPLVSLYLDHLGSSGLVSISDALLVLIGKWNSAPKLFSRYSPECYSQTLQDLTMVAVSPKYKVTATESRKSLLLASRWLSSMARTLPNLLGESPNANNVIEALGFLVASIAASDGGLEALSPGGDPARNELRESIRHAFELCLPLYSVLSAQLMERLNTVLKHINLLDNGSSQQGAGQPSAMQILQFQVSIPESEMVASKLATSLYLEALLMTGATIDDAATVNYMCSRHQNDYQSAFMDLVAASFHILKTQQSKSIYYQQCQLFVQNKLPILLSMISGSSFNSFNTEQAIIDGWAYQDLGAVASRFLHTCSLHHLLTAQAVSQLLGIEENNTTKLYAKDDLVSQVRASHTRGPKLVDELVRSDGSAGSISQALVEIMHSYCQSKETQYLKDLVNAILRKPAAINCICLFIRPAFWLGPLCTLLDEWRWDEIHGEAQPVYDEFGAVFLLVLVTKTRLRLSNANVGVRKKDGFLARYFDRENLEESLEKLPEATTSHLGNWVNALYLAEGLSDELFTSCSPHDFYLLIPTLLRQSIVAYQQGKLTQESLKAGLDYLLEPFLLPSLIPALDWVGNLVKEDQMSAEIVLQALLKSPSGSESRDIHQTILGVCAPELEMNIRASQSDKFGFALKVVEQLPESSFSVAKLQDGPVDEVQPHIVALIMQQSSTVGIPAMVRRLIEIQGAELALKSLLGVLLQLSGSPDFLLCLDVIATLVSVVHNGLREVLRLQSGTLGTLLKKGDTLSAEAVVRLHRLVEAYTNFLTPHDMGLDSFDFTNIDTTNPNLDENAPTSGDVEKEPSQADGIDQVLDEVAAMGNMDSNDADMNFDALYGLQGGDMDLNDLDLDMF
ncbi:mediator complex subunit [Exophiala dermatitidis]|uniref:Mediator of RNA polymerase II transcription subunit 5 n=1 Tax=Exophiala dermatitidis TaxID=5970 RepID=A0AAN6ELA7_EXODE|nr:mediator complex subunit [Exophiala dermatitidis]KAJ4505884.1 mediator complex subunit [Exophiala dermatitidis]KAJ4506530.1 mediator complex subunit [Exophiala dermatitidis]KAJ4533716.1 mediator complex subunit [Exophiala dermatitidis]KAJ4539386.1 mediator complex subunit [Exophiala dermatitidis]